MYTPPVNHSSFPDMRDPMQADQVIRQKMIIERNSLQEKLTALKALISPSPQLIPEPMVQKYADYTTLILKAKYNAINEQLKKMINSEKMLEEDNRNESDQLGKLFLFKQALERLLKFTPQEQLSNQEIDLSNEVVTSVLKNKINRNQQKLNALEVVYYMTDPKPFAAEVEAKISAMVKEGLIAKSVRVGGVKYSVLKAPFSLFPFIRPNKELLTNFVKQFDINERGDPGQQFSGHTPLSLMISRAIWSRVLLFMEIALPLGLNVDLKDSVNENNALLLALKVGENQDPTGWKIVVGALIRVTSNINDQDIKGHTALHIAAYRRNRDLVEELLKKGADPTILNKKNLLPADLWRMDINRLEDDKILGHNRGSNAFTFDIEARKLQPAKPPEWLPEYF